MAQSPSDNRARCIGRRLSMAAALILRMFKGITGVYRLRTQDCEGTRVAIDHEYLRSRNIRAVRHRFQERRLLKLACFSAIQLPEGFTNRGQNCFHVCGLSSHSSCRLGDTLPSPLHPCTAQSSVHSSHSSLGSCRCIESGLRHRSCMEELDVLFVANQGAVVVGKAVAKINPTVV